MRHRLSLLVLFGFLSFALLPAAQAAASHRIAGSHARKMKKPKKQPKAKWGNSGRTYSRRV